MISSQVEYITSKLAFQEECPWRQNLIRIKSVNTNGDKRRPQLRFMYFCSFCLLMRRCFLPFVNCNVLNTVRVGFKGSLSRLWQTLCEECDNKLSNNFFYSCVSLSIKLQKAPLHVWETLWKYISLSSEVTCVKGTWNIYPFRIASRISSQC